MWLLLEFGKSFYEKIAYIRFDRAPRMKESFEQDYDMQRLLTSIELHTNCRLDNEETLLILDEIQECPAAITSLKYFCEDLPHLHVVAPVCYENRINGNLWGELYTEQTFISKKSPTARVAGVNRLCLRS